MSEMMAQMDSIVSKRLRKSQSRPQVTGESNCCRTETLPQVTPASTSSATSVPVATESHSNAEAPGDSADVFAYSPDRPVEPSNGTGSSRQHTPAHLSCAGKFAFEEQVCGICSSIPAVPGSNLLLIFRREPGLFPLAQFSASPFMAHLDITTG